MHVGLISTLSPTARAKVFEGFTEAQAEELLNSWSFWARENQTEPEGDWTTWLILAGRGWGKTRCGSEWVLKRVQQGYKRIALIGETAADVRDVMIEGESGILSCCGTSELPLYEPSKRRITWPNGAMAFAYSGDKPDMLRGPQHDSIWADEPAKWRYGEEAWSNMEFGLRLGEMPRVVATTTPRPIPLIKRLAYDPKTHVTKGNTYENLANLSSTFKDAVLAQYENTRLGRQEIYADILEDAPGALWSQELLEAHRSTRFPELRRVVVSIDPAVTSGEDSDETGIVVAGIDEDRHGYVLADGSGHYKPQEWANKAIALMNEWEADRIIAEVNNGGDMVEQTLRTLSANIPYRAVRAAKGKYSRAEPVSALYEHGKVHHCGLFSELEDQMCSFEPGTTSWSPDRMDALVYALSDLMIDLPRTVTVKKVIG